MSERLTDQVLDELEASGVGAARVRLLFPCGDILDDKDYIAVERRSALALVAEVRLLRRVAVAASAFVADGDESADLAAMEKVLRAVGQPLVADLIAAVAAVEGKTG